MTGRNKTLVLNMALTLVYCLLIYIQSSFPSPKTIPDVPHLDKLLHCGAYALLAVLCYRALEALPLELDGKLLVILAIASSTLYGISDEVHHYYVPYREADVMDVVADLLGGVLGVCAYRYLLNRHSVSVRNADR